MGLGFCCKSLEFFKCPSPLLPRALTPGRNGSNDNDFSVHFYPGLSLQAGTVVTTTTFQSTFTHRSDTTGRNGINDRVRGTDYYGHYG